jgi:imidazolonepropionase-like amidohydrolase
MQLDNALEAARHRHDHRLMVCVTIILEKYMRIITADLLFDGVNEEPLRRPAIVIENGAIERVTVQGAAELPSNGDRIDLPGTTLMPGLIDCHIHLIFDGSPDPVSHLLAESDHHALVRMTAHARDMLNAGITTARDLGCRSHLDLEIRRCIEDGVIPGPRLLCVGQPITVTGGHCHFLGGEADGELEIRKAVRRQHKLGVDWLKIFATGGHMTPGSNPYHAQYTVEELIAAREEAHRLEHGIAAHCHGTEGVRRAVMAGVDTLEHCSFQKSGGLDLDERVIEQIVAKGIYVSPTITKNAINPSAEALARMPAGMRETQQVRLQALAKAGAKFISSTDCGIPNNPHTALPTSLEALARLSGLSNYEVLLSTTSRAAEALRIGGVTGTLVAGMHADLIAVRGNPLEDITAVQRPALVMKGGTIYRQEQTAVPVGTGTV